MLAWHSLISSCFSWNHGRGGCQGPGEEKSRMKMKRCLQIHIKWSDGMQEEWFNHPVGLHATRHQTACRGDEKELSMKKRDQHLVTLWLKEKKVFKGWGPTEKGMMRRHHTQSTTFPSHHSSMTDKRVCWKWEKATQVQKKNNLLSAASILFHGKGQ